MSRTVFPVQSGRYGPTRRTGRSVGVGSPHHERAAPKVSVAWAAPDVSSRRYQLSALLVSRSQTGLPSAPRRRPCCPCGSCSKATPHKPPCAPHRSLVPLVATGVDGEEEAISGEGAEDDNQQPDEDLHARHRSTPVSVLRATLQQGRIRNSTRLGRDSTAGVHIRRTPAHILLGVGPSAVPAHKVASCSHRECLRSSYR
jgi:hypothetical protein